MNSYEVKPVKTNKSSIPQPPAVKAGILPTLPASFLIVGKSGSGKSSVLVNLLQNPALLGGYFDYIMYYSGTKTDDIIDALDLPEENIINDFDEEDIERLLDAMEEKIENLSMQEVGKKFKVAIILDDILGRPKFLRSKIMTKLVTCNRHYCISVFVLSQYYKKIPPVIRTNVSSLIMFPSALIEVEKLADEFTEPNQTKQDFVKIVQHATKDQYNFLHINTRGKPGERLRKNFDTILKI